jgi:archaellum component FlaC
MGIKGEILMDKRIEDLLYEYPKLSKDILSLNRELSEFIKSKDDDYGSLGDAGVKFIPQGGNEEYNPILETILHFEKHIKKLSDRINELIEQKEHTEWLLTYLDTTEKRIIELRYFLRLGWYKVSVRAYYNESWCREINKKAIGKMRWWHENTRRN